MVATGIKCRRVKPGIHFDRMRHTTHFSTPIINNCIQFKIDKSYGNGNFLTAYRRKDAL
jgi:hypothetical protein